MVLDTHLVGQYDYATTVWNTSGTGASNFAALNSANTDDTDATGRFLFIVCNNGSNSVRAIPLTAALATYSASGIVNYSNIASIQIAEGANDSIPPDCWFKFYGVK